MIIVVGLLNDNWEYWIGVYEDPIPGHIHHDILYIPNIFHLDYFLAKLGGTNE